ncbi:hypothetical protein IT774_15230 [Salinimonas marina]|uniref:Uncharacterized protein n=1 Tax=Salinimonas marina TaxID=2785918 RepID=A0A7S9DX04_9ALTE|nr:hypothetical protein [Salinimonas marina]QPG05430.1 hypothetical protein IT774_15230 [Salinimonas marina]
MFMRIKTHLKNLSSAAFVLTAVWAMAWVVIPQQQPQCLSETEAASMVTSLSDSLPDCLQNASVNWHDWVAGHSRSYQFHFFDLLELLDGGGNDNRFSAGQ